MFARALASGALAATNGRVEVRYKPNDGRAYFARADNLEIVAGALLPDEHCAAADAVPRKDAGSGSTGASGASPAGAEGASAKVAARTVKRKTSPKTAGAATDEAPATDAGGSKAITVYADGACSGNPGPAGLGVVLLDGESRVEVSEYIGQATNNVAELSAILRAIVEVADSERPIHIHTDSSYAIGVLQKGWKAKANADLVAEIRDAIRARRSVRLFYVPGHAGVAGNERADSLARDAVSSRKTTRRVVSRTLAKS